MVTGSPRWTLILGNALPVLGVLSAKGRATYPTMEHLRTGAADAFANISTRCMILFGFAWIAHWLGHWSLVAFLAVASAFVTWVDLHENWLSALQKRAEAAGKARRERATIDRP